MTLAPGARLGAYEILSPIGAGGMGEVYRARDARLGRDVAIKVLPPGVAADAERVARFEREAQVLASLNHPNIAHIHGVEDSTGTLALVMELVEGPTLADRIAKGPIPLDEALAIAKQIAEGLEAAHEQGIIHRDLKPANIKVRPDGTVKVLDFGLAKAFEPKQPSGINVTQSPTITTPALMTGLGIILGTAAYMSPEQARGKAIDQRSDIWAFGCVLYEMLTGTRLFEGEDVSETLAAVLRVEPEWDRLPSATPEYITTLLRRCLQKDLRKRLPHIGIARIEIEEGAAVNVQERAVADPIDRRRSTIRVALYLVTFAAGASMLTAFVARKGARTSKPTLSVQRLTISLPSSAQVSPGSFVLSRDGTRLVYSGQAPDGRPSLYLRYLDQLDPRPLPGTENGTDPFFSPDGEWVGFYSGATTDARALKRVAIRGGTPLTVAGSLFGSLAGIAWRPDDQIVFSMGTRLAGPTSPQSLFVVSAAGGTPQRIRPPSAALETDERWPDPLPDGRHMLVSVRTGPSLGSRESHIAVMSVDGQVIRTVIDNGYRARYVSSGHVVYASGGALMAIPFDVERLQPIGAPQLLAENLGPPSPRGDATFDVSQSGVLVYSVAGTTSTMPRRTLVWVDRNGREEPIPAPVRAYFYPRISPDGTRVAIDVRDESADIWMWDVARRVLARVTTDPGQEYYPTWSPDGRRLAFASTRTGRGFNVFWQNADGTGPVEQLTDAPRAQSPYAFTPDGKQLIFRDSDEKTGDDLMVISLEPTAASATKERPVVPIVRTTFNEINGEVSPDGRWLAYESNESGRSEIYVRPFPKTAEGRWPISADGGTKPVWARNGRELFYLVGSSPNPIRMMRVAVNISNGFSASVPETLFEGRYVADARTISRGRTYDVSPDGQRFLMVKAADPAEPAFGPQALIAVLNWQEALNRKNPPER